MDKLDMKPDTLERTREINDDNRGSTSGTNDIVLVDSPTETTRVLERSTSTRSTQTYKVYKRRFFGLGQLVLLNIVVSWDVRQHL